MPFATKEQERAYRRARRAADPEGARARDRARRERQRNDERRREQLNSATKRYRATAKYRGRVLAKDRLLDPSTVAHRRAALRWDRLFASVLEAVRAEELADSRDAELRALSEIWTLSTRNGCLE